MSTSQLALTGVEKFEKKSLIFKLAEACSAVKYVPKLGENKDQHGKLRYNYVKAADVANAIRAEFLSRNIILVCDEKEYTQTRVIRTNSGGEMAEFSLRCEYTFHDGDTGEKLGPFGAFGVAMDSGDKAIYKAKTGALKYVLRGIGLIPDENADPEADTNVDEVASQPHTQRSVQGVPVEFENAAPLEYDESELLDAPPASRAAVPVRSAQPGACPGCGGKMIPAGISKKPPYKAYPAFCKEKCGKKQ